MNETDRIAEPYCNWKRDDLSDHTPFATLRFVFLGMVIIGFLSLFLYAALWEDKANPPVWIMPLALTTLSTFFIWAVVESKIKSKKYLCLSCRKPMKRRQSNYPFDPNVGLTGLFLDDFQGEDGRVYAEYSVGGKGNSTRWGRVFQELRVCEPCKCYVLINDKKIVDLGSNRQAAEEYEARVSSHREALAGKKFRLKSKP